MCAALRRKVPQFLVELKVGQLARSNLPAYDDNQYKNGQPEDKFHFPHDGNR